MTSHAPVHALYSVKAFVLAISACAALLTASTSQAQHTFFGDDFTMTEAMFNALGVTAVPITGIEGSTYITYQTSAGTQTVSVTNNGDNVNKYIQRRDQLGSGGVFGGNFPSGTPLLRNVAASSTANVADAMVITFSSPVSAFGFNYDPTLPAAFTDFTFDVFEGGINPAFTTSTSQDVNTGRTPTGPNDMTAPFFGVSEAGGNLITALRITGAPTDPPVSGSPTNTAPNDFAVGLLRFKVSPTAPPPSVPEPGNVALIMGMALTGAGCFARRKRQIANQ